MNMFFFYFFTLDHTRLDNTIPDSPNTLQGVTGVATDQQSKPVVICQQYTNNSKQKLYTKIIKYKIQSERDE